MSETDIDQYLARLEGPEREALSQLRATILATVPDAEQCISYGMPAFRLNGKVVAGFAAFKHHLSYLPHSGSVLPELADELSRYSQTKGSLHFLVSEPLPAPLVEQLVNVRIAQAFGPA